MAKNDKADLEHARATAKPVGEDLSRRVSELIGSMRFAIALLTVISIASAVGTVLQQGQRFVDYADKFGFFWAGFFQKLGLFDVYGAWWFLLILAFLVLSTSICVFNNAPGFLRQMRDYKTQVAVRSLHNIGHSQQIALPRASSEGADMAQTLLPAYAHWLADTGWKVKTKVRAGKGTMLAAKRGSSNKLGYIAAHGAIVLICLGGLLDGSLLTTAQLWLGDKTPFTGTGLIADIPQQHRLSASNVSFRGTMRVTEGGYNDTVLLNQQEGVLVQELPFEVRLKKFIVEHYSTGMPKLFASDIEVVDKETQVVTTARVEVNKPFTYRGVSIYQSDFGDGGSRVGLTPVSLYMGVKPDTRQVNANIGGAVVFRLGDDSKQLELEELRVFNVNDFALAEAGKEAENTSELAQTLDKARKVRMDKTLRNVGPSIVYKLRDDAGQAREYHNYMLPVPIQEGEPPVFLFGVRENLNEDYRYLRIAADDKGSMQGFFNLRMALADAQLRAQAAQRFAKEATDQPVEVQRNMEQIGNKVLDLFAGVGSSVGGDGKTATGLQAVANYIEANAPAQQAQQDSALFIRILNGCLWQLMQISRELNGQPVLELTPYNQAWLLQNVVSLSDVAFYPEPTVFVLKDFEQIQASVFQLTKAPAKWLVYLGCTLLTIGVFAMLFVRERRLWLWMPEQAQANSSEKNSKYADAEEQNMVLAMSSNRKTVDEDAAFEAVCDGLQHCMQTIKGTSA